MILYLICYVIILTSAVVSIFHINKDSGKVFWMSITVATIALMVAGSMAHLQWINANK